MFLGKIFLGVFRLGLRASFFIGAILLLRPFLRKVPRWIPCVLWVLAAVRLMVPFSVESRWSLVPDWAFLRTTETNRNGMEEKGNRIQKKNDVGKDNDEKDNNITIADHEEMTAGERNGRTGAWEEKGSGEIAYERNEYDRLKENKIQESNDVPVRDFIVENMTLDKIFYSVLVRVGSIVWLIGVAAMLFYGWLSLRKIRRMVSSACICEEGFYVSEKVTEPFVMGIFRPMIYLPADMDPKEQEYVLYHERAHVSRGDYFWKPLGFVLLCIYWFHPLCWISYLLFCRDVELACDEKVIRGMDQEKRAFYCEVLLRYGIEKGIVYGNPVAFGEIGVKERIKAVLDYKKRGRMVTALSLIVTLVIVIAFMTSPAGKAEDLSYDLPTSTVQEDAEDLPSGSPTSTVQEDVEYFSSTPPTTINQEDFMAACIAKSHEYGYPFVLDEVNLDINADGKSDCIRLLENWYPIFNESDEPSYHPGGLHYPNIEFDVNGKKHSFVWNELSYKSSLFALKDAKSSNIVVVTRDIGGTGMGNIGMNAFMFSDNIYELPLPSFETAYGATQGFPAIALYADNYCMTIIVEDTGFSGRLSLPKNENDYFDYSMYDDQGVCINKERAAEVGAICDVRVMDYHGQDALELYQPISGTAPMEHFGYLVSVVTWDAEGYKILEQRVESK